jgi:HK97 family phage prohead protease
MTELHISRAEAALARGLAAADHVMPTPVGRPVSPPIRAASAMRAGKVTRNDEDWFEVEGYASVVERGYDMWDAFGPYTETVSCGAFDATLAATPDVVYRFNHGGTPMAGTRNNRLELSADSTGLSDRAWLNPKRDDVKLLIQAIEDDDIREQSFQFEIVSGKWSPDFTEYRIDEVNLDRGDVGPVSRGANPHTSVTTRGADFLADIPNLPTLLAREAMWRLSTRKDLTVAKAAIVKKRVDAGLSVALVRAQIDAEKDVGL